MSVISRSFLPTPPPVVFVVDENLSGREALAMLIRRAGWGAKTFASGEEFLAQPRLLTPSCLVLAVPLPDLDGLHLQRLLAQRTELPIIFLTGCVDVPMAVQAMKAGAVEFLTKPLDEEALLNAIAQALERSAAALHHEAEIRSLRARYESLTRREREVMTLVVAGRLNKQSGAELGISEITVKAHRGNLMHKMHARSLPELVTMAATLGLGLARDHFPAQAAAARPPARPSSDFGLFHSNPFAVDLG
jgi:FixJ family two-component response regulator